MSARGRERLPDVGKMLRLRSLRVMLWLLAFVGLVEATMRARTAWLYGSATANDSVLYISHPTFGRVLKPNTSIRGERTQLSINSLGFRWREIPRAKAEGIYRIACLGDSSVFGRQERDEEVWPAVLEGTLRERLGREIEVINAGVPGYTMEINTQVLKHVLAPLEVDMVVVYQHINDIRTGCYAAFGGEAAGPRGLKVEGHLSKWCERSLLSYHLIRSNLGPHLRPVRDEQGRRDEICPSMTENYRERLEELISAAEAENIKVALATACKSFCRSQPAESQLLAAAGMMMNNPYLSLAGIHHAFDSYNEVIRSVAARRGVVLLDLGAMVPPQQEYFLDAVHFNVPGHRIVGQLLGERLAEVLAEAMEDGV